MWFDEIKDLPPDDRLAAIEKLPCSLEVWATQESSYRYRGRDYFLTKGKNVLPRDAAVWLMVKGKPGISDRRSEKPKKAKNGGVEQHSDL
jgi:hypothetical protein